MELNQLRYLIAVADAGSFTQAARNLRLSQPSLSLAIKKLEEEVGQPLFDRLTRRVVLTEAGGHLLETARRTLADLDRSVSEVRDLKGEVSGNLRIGAIPTIAPFVLPEVICAFSAAYPNVQLHITENVTTRLAQMLETGEIDVAITSTLPDLPGIHTEHAGNEKLLVILPPDHRLVDNAELNWASLEDEPFLVLSDEHCLGEQMSWFCRKNNLTSRTMLDGAQLVTIAALVERGLGISLVPAMMEQAGYAGCVFRRVEDSSPFRPICLSWSLLRYRTQAGRKFMDMAREKLDGMLTDLKAGQI